METALHIAIKNNYAIYILEWIFLLKRSFANQPDSFGRTALHLAVELKRYDVIQLLFKNADDYAEEVDVNATTLVNSSYSHRSRNGG